MPHPFISRFIFLFKGVFLKIRRHTFREYRWWRRCNRISKHYFFLISSLTLKKFWVYVTLVPDGNESDGVRQAAILSMSFNGDGVERRHVRVWKKLKSKRVSGGSIPEQYRGNLYYRASGGGDSGVDRSWRRRQRNFGWSGLFECEADEFYGLFENVLSSEYMIFPPQLNFLKLFHH